MMTACIWDKDRDTITHYENVRLCAAGVLITLDAGTPDYAEVLIPYGSGRIHEVFSETPGEIGLELGSG